MTIFLLHWWPTEIQNLSKEKYFDANLQSKNLGRPALSAPAVLCRPVVLQLANKACHVKVQTQGQILVTLHVRPAPQKHAHDAAELFTHVLAGFPPQTVILTDYRLKSDRQKPCWDQARLSSQVNKQVGITCVVHETQLGSVSLPYSLVGSRLYRCSSQSAMLKEVYC